MNDEFAEMFSDIRQAVDLAEDHIEKERFDQTLTELQMARMWCEDIKDAVETRGTT